MGRDSLIRHAKERFAAHRVRYLIIAKFLPGVNPLAAGLAGVVPIRPDRFLLYSTVGSLLWAGAWITLGYLCADVIGLVANRVARLWRPVLIAIAAGLIIYVVFKFARRRRRIHRLRSLGVFRGLSPEILDRPSSSQSNPPLSIGVRLAPLHEHAARNRDAGSSGRVVMEGHHA